VGINNRNITSYGFSQPLTQYQPSTIIAQRAPTVADLAVLGQVWINAVTQLSYILVNIAAGQGTWSLLEASGGTGTFTTLTVTGNATVGGTLGVTGATTLSSTLNVTGAILGSSTIASTGLISSDGAVTAGGVAYFAAGNGLTSPLITAGSGVPTLSAPIGSIYLRTDGSSTSTRLYVATTTTGTWTNVVTAA
jgi:hypothetical protein